VAGIFNTITALQRPLDFHLERHGVLASNIANVDTPGFRSRDLVRGTPADFGNTLSMAATAEGHIGALGGTSAEPRVAIEDSTAPGRDGNSVSLELEMSRLGANDLRYDAVAQMVTRHLGMLRYAASDGTSG
jgi:flagellar basal-body rod protein FlgB